MEKKYTCPGTILQGIFYLINFLYCFSITPAFAQSLELDWARGFGGTGSVEIACAKTDISGNLYVIGSFGGTVDFDPGTGSYTLSVPASNGLSSSVFILKLDSDGNFVWVKQIDLSGPNSFLSPKLLRGHDLAIDSIGDIVITGSFGGDSVDFDPGPQVYRLGSTATPPGVLLVPSTSLFVLKLNSSGEFVWAKSMLIASSLDRSGIEASRVDCHENNIYICGLYSGKNAVFEFDPVGSNFTVSIPSHTNTSHNRLFVQKLNANGDFLWAFPVFGDTASSFDGGKLNLRCDNAGNVVLAGTFSEGALDFDPGSGSHLLSAPLNSLEENVFIAKYSTMGVMQWARQTEGGRHYIGPHALAIDRTNAVYLTGVFDLDSCNFDPIFNNYDYFVAYNNAVQGYLFKVSDTGFFQWIKVLPNGMGVTTGNVNVLSIDDQSSVYLSGNFNGITQFDWTNPVPSASSLLDASHGSAFVLNADTAGSFKWAGQFSFDPLSVSGFDRPRVVSHSIDTFGNVHMVGTFGGIVDFDPTLDSFNLAASGVNVDGFAIKLSPSLCQPTDSLLLINTCDSVVSVNGFLYATTGTYTQLLLNAAGCDSLLTIDITMNHPTGSYHNFTACDSFNYNGQEYYADGNYMQTFVNVLGCDSLVEFNLTLLNTVDTIWSITACKPYFFNGIVYNNSGTYQHSFTGSDGCDSIITLDLVLFQPDTSVTQNGAVLSANAFDATYQWMDCGTGQILPGEVYSTFTIPDDGGYAVIVSQNGCTDTSACYINGKTGLVTPLSIDDATLIYPNPVVGNLIVEFPQRISYGQLLVRDMFGRTLITTNMVDGSKFYIDTRDLSAGSYLITISINQHTSHCKFIKR